MESPKYRFLYIFPHPDDESFGPAPVIHQQLKAGHEVFLLTLTRGGATRQRFALNKTIEEMGEIRYKEMLVVEKTLGLTGMTVLDLPDSGMQEMDPREIENVVKEHILNIRPDIIVSYPVHGNSGFHDHLVMHAVIKRVYLEMKDEGDDFVKRLAFITLPDKPDKPVFLDDDTFRIRQSPDELIDCIVKLQKDDIEMMKKTLACYSTYKDVIDKSGVVDKVGDKVYFEFYGEDFTPPVGDVVDELS